LKEKEHKEMSHHEKFKCVGKSVHFCKDVSVKGNTKLHDTEVCGDLKVQKNQEVCGNLTVKGDTEVHGDLKVNRCFHVSGSLKPTLSLEEPCYTVPCDTDAYVHEVIFTDRVGPLGEVTSLLPLEGIADQNIPEGSNISLDSGLIITNVQGDGVTDGPWYVEEQEGTQVVTCGIRENYAPPPGGPFPELNPPGDATTSIATITVDTGIISGTQQALVDLKVGYSTEPNYDFLIVRKNGIVLSQLSGSGPEEDPYLRATLVNITVAGGDVIEIVMTKDVAWLAGVDSVYFYPCNLRVVDQIQTPTSIVVVRDDVAIFNYQNKSNVSFDDVRTQPGIIEADLSLQAGDQIKLLTDLAYYTKFDVQLCLEDRKTVLRHCKPNEFVEKVAFNEICYNNITPSANEQLGGWYESDGWGLGLCFFKDEGSQILCFNNPNTGMGGYYLNDGFWTFPDSSPFFFDKVAHNSFLDPFGEPWVFDPSAGELRLDWENNPASLDVMVRFQAFWGTLFRKVPDPDAKLWEYKQRICNKSTILNSPRELFRYLYNNYLTGFASGYVSKTTNLWPSIPESADNSQVKRAVGGASRNQFDDLFEKLMSTGTTYEYGVKRLVYWPYPNTVGDATLRESYQWHMNQNRYNFLGLVLDVPNEGNQYGEYAVICPGERVILKNTGVARFDDFEFRLTVGAYNTGPRPPATHIPQWMRDNWTTYTMRLPMVIDGTNDTIFSGATAGTPIEYHIPHGTYYLSEITDIIGAAFWNLEIDVTLQLGRYNGDNLSLIFGDGIIEILNEFFLNQLVFISFAGLSLYGPDHPTYKSTFFGPNGLDIGARFGGGQVVDFVSNLDPALILRPQDYKAHTPLTEMEASDLMDNIGNIKMCIQHGPVSNGMPYDNFVACAYELNTAHTGEFHQCIGAYSQRGESGLDELYLDYDDLTVALKRAFANFDPDATYSIAISVRDQPLPGIRSIFIRCGAEGNPFEGSELYRAGDANFFNRINQEQGGIPAKLALQPARDEKFYYPPGTVIPGFGDISLRETEPAIVNYLSEARWMTQGVGGGGEPTFDFAAYETHAFEITGMADGSSPPVNPDVVAGDWLVGILKDSVVERAFIERGEAVPNPLPKYGYITNFFTSFSFSGDQTLLPWYDPDYEAVGSGAFFATNIAAGVAMVARIFQYFNENGVSHMIVDKRTAVGGGSPVTFAMNLLMGGERKLNMDEYRVFQPLQQNGIQEGYSVFDTIKKAEAEGVYTYPVLGVSSGDVISPSAYLAAGVPAISFFNGSGGSTKNVIWIQSNTSSSGTQSDYAVTKGSSLNQSTFDGDLGANTCVTMYGTYHLPFSTGGNYESYVNWYGENRKGMEEVPLPPLWGADRWETFQNCYRIDGVLTSQAGYDQLNRPHILWDMNSDVWIQDIGFTTDGPNIIPEIDGNPWIAQRGNVSTVVDYCDPFSWRDAILERSVTMANDPNLKDHHYAGDSYGFVADPTP
jgi:hypothetical protein